MVPNTKMPAIGSDDILFWILIDFKQFQQLTQSYIKKFGFWQTFENNEISTEIDAIYTNFNYS